MSAERHEKGRGCARERANRCGAVEGNHPEFLLLCAVGPAQHFLVPDGYCKVDVVLELLQVLHLLNTLHGILPVEDCRLVVSIDPAISEPDARRAHGKLSDEFHDQATLLGLALLPALVLRGQPAVVS